jgi:hypothetical protein
MLKKMLNRSVSASELQTDDRKLAALLSSSIVGKMLDEHEDALKVIRERHAVELKNVETAELAKFPQYGCDDDSFWWLQGTGLDGLSSIRGRSHGVDMFASPVARPKSNAAVSARSRSPAARWLRPARAFGGTPAGAVYESGFGNQAVLRRLAAQTDNTSALPEGPQPKLPIGAVDDPLEHAADHAAAQVMRMPGPASPAASGVQVSHTSAAGEAPPLVHDVLRGSGQPLDPAARAFFEPRFGQDFSDVRVHADSAAARSAAAVAARAYTVGPRVAFAAGQYAPDTAAGRRLLAHELAHVVQQRTDHAPALRRDKTAPPTPLPTALDQYPETERKSLVVRTDPMPAADIARIYAPVAPGGVKTTLNPSSSIEFAFSSNIAAGAQANLKQVGALLSGQVTPPLSPGQTISVQVAPIGMIVRFSRIAHEKPVRDVLLVEQLGPIPAAAPAATTGTTKFVTKKYSFDATLSDAGEQNAVRQAVEAVPDSALRENLVFARGSGATSPKGEAGLYEPLTMTVRLWDTAFAASVTSSGPTAEVTRSIVHELGHAIDRKPLDDAFAANKSAPSADNERKILAARTMSGLRAQKSGTNFTEDEVVRDLTVAFRAAAVKDGVKVDTTNPPRTTAVGTTATLAGSPTDYADTGWVELFAESFSLFVTDPNLLRSIRPNISAFMAKSFP